MFGQAQLRSCVDAIIDAVDFPMLGNEGAVPFLTDSGLSDAEQAKIAHALLGLGPSAA